MPNMTYSPTAYCFDGTCGGCPSCGVFITGDDPVELRPVRRITATSKLTCPGIKGGQGHSGAELERDARESLVVLGLAVAVMLGIGCAELIANAADSIGAWCVS